MPAVEIAAPVLEPMEAACVPDPEICSLSVLANRTPGEVRCPVCFQLVSPEHIGYKLHCRKCGYLESCCNPI